MSTINYRYVKCQLIFGNSRYDCLSNYVIGVWKVIITQHQQVSVIVPTLGLRKQYLIEALHSINSQTLLPIEIIVVNNGILKLPPIELEYSSRVPIKIIDSVTKAGAPQARNIGAALAKGNFLAFLDDDDLWGHTFLEAAMQAILVNEMDCCLGRIDKLENGKINVFMNATNLLTVRSFLIMNPGATGSNILIKEEVFRKIGGFDTNLSPCEDRAFMVELIQSEYQVCVSSTGQAIMRMHDQERLTTSLTINLGFRQFHRKYKNLMGWRDRIYSNWLFRKEEYRNKKTYPRLSVLMLLSLVILVIGRRPSKIWANPTAVAH